MEVDLEEFAWITQCGGPAVRWSDSHRHRVEGDGLGEGWFAMTVGSSQRMRLDKHIDVADGTLMLAISPSSQPSADCVVRWNSTLKLRVGEDRYVRTNGMAPNFPAALAAVESYVHESRQIGGLAWWRETNEWVSWVGGFDLKATEISGRWRFEISGYAPTFEEAALLAVMGGRG